MKKSINPDRNGACYFFPYLNAILDSGNAGLADNVFNKSVKPYAVFPA